MRFTKLTYLCPAIVAVAMAALSTYAQAQTTENPPTNGQVQIVAEKMCCAGCAQKVTSQVYVVRGVRSVAVDLPTHTVTIEHGESTPVVFGRLWNAVQVGNGGPISLATRDATYQLSIPSDGESLEALKRMGATQHVVIEGLEDQQQVERIASQLHQIKEVARVSVDLPAATLIVEAQPKKSVSPWVMMEAIARTGERPLAFTGSYGTLSIEWNNPSASRPQHPNQSLR